MNKQFLTAIGLASALLALQATPVTASEPVYRWRDANGKMHFGSRPPPGSEAESVRVREGTTEAKKVTRELTPAEKQQIEFCETARKNLEMLSGPTDIMRVDEYGLKQKLTPEEKEAERVRAVEAVRKQCPPES
jgi:hypothetical protein